MIAGTAGAGKTSLALHWAHQVRDRFPDGQLYVNLRGYDPGRPVTAEEALHRLLTSLGIPASAVPRDLDAASALYRSLLAVRDSARRLTLGTCPIPLRTAAERAASHPHLRLPDLTSSGERFEMSGVLRRSRRTTTTARPLTPGARGRAATTVGWIR
ncbi:hypothetical protein [Streptomyces sp. NPDC094437]|uniref:hypothetical protein n=1 Tax=Streptomyces sp. NPDC094437 TaxID=3366060 RepID=UPI0037F6D286